MSDFGLRLIPSTTSDILTSFSIDPSNWKKKWIERHNRVTFPIFPLSSFPVVFFSFFFHFLFSVDQFTNGRSFMNYEWVCFIFFFFFHFLSFFAHQFMNGGLIHEGCFFFCYLLAGEAELRKCDFLLGSDFRLNWTLRFSFGLLSLLKIVKKRKEKFSHCCFFKNKSGKEMENLHFMSKVLDMFFFCFNIYTTN